MKYALRTYNLTKQYNKDTVVEDVSFNIKKGEIYGLLGPNGAGKTTIMKMLSNLVKPSLGEIEILGEKFTQESHEILKKIGTLIEYPVFYDTLTAKQNLYLHCEYMGYHNNSVDKALELVNLHGVEGKAVKYFSLGMKQKLGIARAIITEPEILILDEPINGLDPIAIKEIRDLLRMLNKECGVTILISSHILSEIEQLVDTIGVINKSRLIKEISVEKIKSEGTNYIEIVSDDIKKAVYILEYELNISNLKIINDKMLRIYSTDVSNSIISKRLILNDINIEKILTQSNSLEEYLLNILNGGSENV